jgi:hypothetical protein
MFTVQGRQKVGLLFPVRPPNAPDPFPALLAAGAAATYGPFELDGYSTVTILAVSDKPFTIAVVESVIPTGPFIQTQSFASAAVGALQVVQKRFAPSGAFGKATLTNTGAAPQTQISILGQGIPLP